MTEMTKSDVYLMAEITELHEIPIAVSLLRFANFDYANKIIVILLEYYLDYRDSWEEDLYLWNYLTLFLN